MSGMDSARELRASLTVDASPQKVWDTVTDFSNLAAASPELVTMLAIGRGGPRPGQTYIGLNRRRLVVWPTRNRIRTVEPERELSWDTVTSGARWVFGLVERGDQTVLTLSRPVPGKLTALSNLFAKVLLGGAEGHADELDQGITETLRELKLRAEGRSLPPGVGRHRHGSAR